MILGYLLPTILMFIPFRDLGTTQNLIAFWQPSPIYVNVLLILFASIYSRLYPRIRSNSKAHAAAQNDMKDLTYIYYSAFFVGAMVHFIVAATIILSPNLSFSQVFLPSNLHHWIFSESMRSDIWLPDFWIFTLACLHWCIFSIWDLWRVGRTNVNIYKALMLFMLSSVIVGPGAAVAGCWYWRELVMTYTTVPRTSP